jgi:hypothetical protein
MVGRMNHLVVCGPGHDQKRFLGTAAQVLPGPREDARNVPLSQHGPGMPQTAR